MTSLVEPVSLVNETNIPFSFDTYANTHKNRQISHAVKSREIKHKLKYNKALKRKLKKYKLRQDGGEDEDVLDVSKILVSSLIIKSPSNCKESVNTEGECGNFEELRPKNYLTKMVRRKNGKLTTKHDKPDTLDEIVNNQNVHALQSAVTLSDQEKKQTNAFKLLMDSRNKSIGSNSPGKEKHIDGSDDEEFLEKKHLKAKRNKLLQKMAEAKGSLKRKEMEEYQEECIKRKMETRAEKFKSMIVNDKKATVKNKNDITLKKDNEVNDSELVSKDDKVYKKSVPKKKVKTLQIVDIFNSLEEPIVISPVKKHISKEDKEFISKLSPSLKKKESMLSYFKKLGKECDDSADNLIRVKLGPKPKKKGKKKKLSLNRNVLEDILPDSNQKTEQTNYEITGKDSVKDQQEPLDVNTANGKQKRKRNCKDIKSCNIEGESIEISENRPKRSVKRPVKYIDDAVLASSDEELHIFTPKKKKYKESLADSALTKDKLDNTNSDSTKTKPKPDKRVTKDCSELKKPVKLAPIFKKQSVDPAALEAKQKFLQSGVPDKLKKIINQQKNSNITESAFPVVVHVQQKETIGAMVTEKNINIPESDDGKEISLKSFEDNAYKKLLELHQMNSIINLDSNSRSSIKSLLQTLKEIYPKFPVYRTYRYLRGKSKGEFQDYKCIEFDNSIEIMNGVVDVTNDSPDRLNWTDKFKALSTSHIIGNFDSTKELRKWLVLWTENEMKSKAKATCGSDSSDYYQSDTDSRESGKSMNNLLMLTGPTGCGKTASVYAVAAELAMKVIEVNASSKRTGKIMLQDLQEATQSHKVNRGTGTSENSQKSQDKLPCEVPKKLKKRGRPKKIVENNLKQVSQGSSDLSGTPASQENVRTDTSLILIDDADIVFEQDDGFASAIVQLVQYSKRPVILVTSTLMCPHLQRFQQYGKILKMYPLSPRMLGTWLDIMCLADTGTCWPGVGAKFLNHFRGDIRKTINYLQFYTSTYANTNSDEEAVSQNIDNYKVNIDDENSGMSWADHEYSEGKKCLDNNYINMESNNIWNDFIGKQSNLLIFKQPVQIFNIWWSVPCLLGITPDTHETKDARTGSLKDKIVTLEAVANAIDAISLADYFSHTNQSVDFNITSEPWYSTVSDSVYDQESIDSYVKSYEVGNQITHTLVTGSVLRAQYILSSNKESNLHSPGMTLQRQKDKVLSRHMSLTSYLNPSAVLDRRALALDYWPSCRAICRTEKTKTDVNIKRHNRFCHYLKSVSVLCKSDTFDNLGDSLHSNYRNESIVTNINE